MLVNADDQLALPEVQFYPQLTSNEAGKLVYTGMDKETVISSVQELCELYVEDSLDMSFVDLIIRPNKPPTDLAQYERCDGEAISGYPDGLKAWFDELPCKPSVAATHIIPLQSVFEASLSPLPSHR